MPRYRPLSKKEKGIKFYIDLRAKRDGKPDFLAFDSHVRLGLNMTALMKIMDIRSYPAMKGWLEQYRDEYVSPTDQVAFNKRYRLNRSNTDAASA